MANTILPTFPALASGAIFTKGFSYTASGNAEYISFGHSFQIGQLPTGNGLEVNFGFGSVPCQIDVKTSYLDGSAAWGIVTVQAPAMPGSGMAWGQFSPTSGQAAPLSLVSALGSTTLVLKLNATTPAQVFTEDLIALIKNAAFDPWLNGPLAVQGRAGATLYEGLRIVADITAYADGTVNADIMVANDIAMLASAGTVDYTATVTLNGNTAYTSTALTHYQYTNWTVQVGTRGTLPQVIHNPADFINAQAVQPWDLTLGVDPSVISGADSIISASGFGKPFTNPGGMMDQSMGDTGGRTDIGPNDAWDVYWFTTQDPNLFKVAVEGAKIGGGIPWHFWNANSGDNWKITDTYGNPPTVGLWFGQQTNSWTIPLTQAVPSGPGWNTDESHFPEVAFLPALLIGRRYYVDELNTATYWALISQWTFYRSDRLTSDLWDEYCGTEGYMFPGNQIRGGAWAIRNLFYSYYATPDGDSRKAYIKQVIDNNFTWLNNQTSGWTTLEGQLSGYVPIGVCSVYGTDQSNMPPWQQDYAFSSIAMGAMMGYQPAMQFAEWMSNYIVNRFASGVAGWYPQDGMVYNMILFPGGYGNPSTTPPQTWAAAETLLQNAGISQVTSGVPTWTSQPMGDYAALAWNSLYEAQTLGFPGAQEMLTETIGWNIPQTNQTTYWTTLSGPAKMAARTLNASQIMATGTPSIIITAVDLSNNSVNYAAPTGTVVGTISVALNTGTFSGTLALSGTSDFVLNGNALITNALLSPGQYSGDIIATQAGVSNSPYTQPFTVTAAAAPLMINSVVLSGNTFAYGAPAGTTVGLIEITMSSGTFSGALELSGADANDFSINGRNLITSGSLASGIYNFNIIATDNAASNSPFTQAFVVSGLAAPLPSISGIALSGNTFPYGAANGYVVGTILVSMSDNSAFSGMLGEGGPNSGSFTLSGMSLETSGSLASGSYNIAITATPANSGIAPFTQSFTVTGLGETLSEFVTQAQTDLASTITGAKAALASLINNATALETTEEENLDAAIKALVTQITGFKSTALAELATLTTDLNNIANAI